MTKTTLSKNIQPTARKFLETVNANEGPQLYELSVADARAVLTGLQKGPVEKKAADIEDISVPGGPGGSVSIRIVRPPGSKAVLPAILYLHGGGWVLGDKDTHDRLIREIAVGTDAAVVFVNYTPSPEAQFPVAIEEAYAALMYVFEKGAKHRLDATRIAIAGDSAGGALAAAVTMLAKERKTPPLACQVLFYPVTDANFHTSSYDNLATDHFLTRGAMKWFWDNSAPDPSDRAKPTAAPLQASLEDLSGLPPALVITGEFDVLRDEGEAYAHKLTEAGVRVTAVRYLGIIHDFVMLDVVADTPQAQSAVSLAIATLRSALQIT
jgi:acetyl esterase